MVLASLSVGGLAGRLVRAALVVAATVAVWALSAGCGADVRGVEVGDRAPQFTAFDLAGEEVTLDDHLGEVVLLNIWATWCGPCRVEMPPIQASYDRYKDQGFTVLAVSIDQGPRYKEKVTDFAEEYGLDFPILLDPDGRITEVLRTVGVPETFVLGRDGRIVKRLIGATDWNSPGHQALIEELLRM
jgi:peroxiredoxin